ncbi:hypothetical protein GLAREA_12571 [Glarea lozoyensis ATCC 20868]|uniref:Uncharacterized protein n=1 Tax=Glarea lozoyensis (strain ATCC 20868 / MF5171) TaxID=1116229 RepID=S3DY47_GLAL2|nr:uncharacterized protein GLAREA_12571 [Glarea lozoyensis ATCC 20868]EPE31268.1 hypothetical protein GLAREA_12571 [Glarea lozoyensis ATCC 20868]
MRFTSLGALALSAGAAFSKEIAKDEVRGAELYDSGIKHSKIMAAKKAHWESEAAAGAMDSSQFPKLGYTKCINGFADAVPGDPLYKFKCKNMDLYSFISHTDLGAPTGEGSSTWGWTDPDSGREFIAHGAYEGTAMVEITKTGQLVKLGFLPSYAPVGYYSIWHEIRSYKNYMLIGSELPGHGIQIFDMKKLLTIDPASPVTFDGKKDLTGHFADLPLGRTHNVVINEELGYGVSVGAAPRTSPCRAGLIFFDLKDPSNPKSLGCDPQDAYVHDAQCLVYHGPDKQYEGRDICYGYNEDTLTIYDVTYKNASKVISRTSYEGASYTHQGWVLDKNWQQYLLMDDEVDEEDSAGPAADGYPVTYIWDISSLAAPKQTGIYKATNRGIDHNQYVIDGLSYQSNYGAGLRVYDVSSIPTDPTGKGVCETAFFDIYPEDDNAEGGGIVQYSGTWASYAYFKSGYIYINTIERGGYVVKMTKREACKAPTCNADNCLRAMRATSVPGRLAESQEFCGAFTKTFVADVSVLPSYAASACSGNVISRVSSACACLPTA